MRVIIAALALGLILSGCDSSDAQQNYNQELINKQAVQSVGMPAITRFSEKRQLKAIFELRDQAISTVTYIVDLNGRLHRVCDSIGYGIPYATEYTSPQKSSGGSFALPQADPNALYAPASADGTWVLCLDTKTKRTQPLYIEPRIVVSPFELSVK